MRQLSALPSPRPMYSSASANRPAHPTPPLGGEWVINSHHYREKNLNTGLPLLSGVSVSKPQ
jgi:hypothetical protein